MTISQFAQNVGFGLVADLLFALIVALIAIAVGRYVYRKRIRQFFGVTPREKRLPIYLSNIVVNRNGTTGTGPLTEGFFGTAITEVEYYYALILASTIDTRPTYRALRALDPEDVFTPVEPIVCEIRVSPSAEKVEEKTHDSDLMTYLRSEIGRNAVILVGGTPYNTLTLHLMEELDSRFRFIREEQEGRFVRGVQFKEGKKVHKYIRGRASDSDTFTEYYVVEKLTWKLTATSPSGRRDTKVFICAGTCSAATAAAVRLLARNWQRLLRQTDGANFGIMCELELDKEVLRESRPPEVRPIMRHQYNVTFDGELV
jgi:hypothetical protein